MTPDEKTMLDAVVARQKMLMRHYEAYRPTGWHEPSQEYKNVDFLLRQIDARDEMIEQLTRERDGEREEREKCSNALSRKDAAMGELFRRLQSTGVDCSDLIS